MTADQLLRVLREQRTHLALVIDDLGGLAGLVTLEDVVSEATATEGLGVGQCAVSRVTPR